ncbi:MAG TPA: class I lanthipeptide [Thermoanaerobaculia bacterium]|nr:class I lanthipeptide [Thermoanaerobaculia bacterium]
MKKNVQKLKLAKETLQRLTAPELRQVAGGIVYTDDTICCHSGDNNCAQTLNAD